MGTCLSRKFHHAVAESLRPTIVTGRIVIVGTWVRAGAAPCFFSWTCKTTPLNSHEPPSRRSPTSLESFEGVGQPRSSRGWVGLLLRKNDSSPALFSKGCRLCEWDHGENNGYATDRAMWARVCRGIIMVMLLSIRSCNRISRNGFSFSFHAFFNWRRIQYGASWKEALPTFLPLPDSPRASLVCSPRSEHCLHFYPSQTLRTHLSSARRDIFTSPRLSARISRLLGEKRALPTFLSLPDSPRASLVCSPRHFYPSQTLRADLSSARREATSPPAPARTPRSGFRHTKLLSDRQDFPHTSHKLLKLQTSSLTDSTRALLAREMKIAQAKEELAGSSSFAWAISLQTYALAGT